MPSGALLICIPLFHTSTIYDSYLAFIPSMQQACLDRQEAGETPFCRLIVSPKYETTAALPCCYRAFVTRKETGFLPGLGSYCKDCSKTGAKFRACVAGVFQALSACGRASAFGPEASMEVSQT